MIVIRRLASVVVPVLLTACGGRATTGPRDDDSGIGLPVDAGEGGFEPFDPCHLRHPPDATMYSCPSPSLEAGDCIGTPPGWLLPAALVDDASHPVGCTATLPLCGAYGPVTCTCSTPDGLYNPRDANAWVCPN
jgi:hypothetical protein